MTWHKHPTHPHTPSGADTRLAPDISKGRRFVADEPENDIKIQSSLFESLIRLNLFVSVTPQLVPPLAATFTLDKTTQTEKRR